jgi:endo-1,4-beta-xylanase
LFSGSTRRQFLASSAFLGLSGAAAAEQARQGSEPSLSQVAASAGRYFGSAVRFEDIAREEDLRGTVLRECAYLTPEIALKWDAIEPAQGSFQFGSMDALLGFALMQGMKLRGHTLLWHGSVPAWAAELLPAQRSWAPVRRYFEAVLSKYGRVIAQWDVVNEPIETGHRMDGLRDSVFLRAFGPDYIPWALREARRLAPQAELMVNEFALESQDRVEHDRRYHFLKLLERLRRAGAPLDGVGLQAHLELSKGPFAAEAYAGFLREIANLGLFMVVSELDVKEYDYMLSPDQRDRRVADATARYLDVVLAQPAVRGVMTWGLSDRHSWLKVTSDDLARFPGGWRDGSGPGLNRGLPFDSSMRRKPMYRAIADALRHRA